MPNLPLAPCADHDGGVHALCAVDFLSTQGDLLYFAKYVPVLHGSASAWSHAAQHSMQRTQQHTYVIFFRKNWQQDRADESDAAREKFFVPESWEPGLACLLKR